MDFSDFQQTWFWNSVVPVPLGNLVLSLGDKELLMCFPEFHLSSKLFNQVSQLIKSIYAHGVYGFCYENSLKKPLSFSKRLV